MFGSEYKVVNNMLKLKIGPNLVVFVFLLEVSMLTLWVMATTFVISGNGCHPRWQNNMIAD